MSRVIWKTVLTPIEIQTVELPQGAEILCAREQHEQVCIWYRCDPDAQKVPRTLVIGGTGYEIPDAVYLGTAMLQRGALVLHVFEQVVL